MWSGQGGGEAWVRMGWWVGVEGEWGGGLGGILVCDLIMGKGGSGLPFAVYCTIQKDIKNARYQQACRYFVCIQKNTR